MLRNDAVRQPPAIHAGHASLVHRAGRASLVQSRQARCRYSTHTTPVCARKDCLSSGCVLHTILHALPVPLGRDFVKSKERHYCTHGTVHTDAIQGE